MLGKRGWEDLAERNTPTKRSPADKIKKYDGYVKDIDRMKELISILEEIFENINKMNV